ncbi:PREDICTED: LOW QUALITY PROTEIN: uncharacterized protein LOC107194588, partial [Dufourea novaeangliae]|uniref:LOW QUALITY PROTEIN: uncharacterized protein LOC107194588 n=1 Tax=Dufourea novaeangliae TaxID=178035 RepID=UPI0007676828
MVTSVRTRSRVARICEHSRSAMCRSRRNRIYLHGSVGGVIMSREVIPRVHVYSLALFLSTFCKASSISSVLPADCLEYDIAELEGYLSEFHLENVPTINMMIGGFECPPTALPFGALKSDWARLLLLQKALPDKSVLREKLGRLFRILTIAYFQIEEHFDVTKSIPTTFSSLNASSTQESTISTNSKEETKKNLVTDSRETNEISESLVSTTVFGSEESFDGSGNERTTITSWDVTGNSSERNNSGGLGNNALSTDVAFSPVGVETTSTIRLTSEEVVGDKKNLIDSVLNRNDSVDVTGSMDSIKPVTFPVSESNQVITPLTSNVSILSVEYKSTTKNVEKQEEGITESDFVGNTQTTVFEVVEDGFKAVRGRGDSPVFYTLVNFEDQENTIGKKGGSRFTTELSSSPEIFDVKHTTKQNYIHTDRFSGNDDTSSTKSFPRKQSG